MADRSVKVHSPRAGLHTSSVGTSEARIKELEDSNEAGCSVCYWDGKADSLQAGFVTLTPTRNGNVTLAIRRGGEVWETASEVNGISEFARLQLTATSFRQSQLRGQRDVTKVVCVLQ